MMLTAQDLLAAGFKEFTDSFSRADRCFQKRVRSDIWCADETETRYFINVYYYKFQEHEIWELDMAFDRDDSRFPYCWLKFQISETATVDDIVNMSMETFAKNRGLPYGD